MTPESCEDMRLCPDVIEHRVKIEGLETSWERVEKQLDRLLWALLGSMAVSAGTLLVLLIKH